MKNLQFIFHENNSFVYEEPVTTVGYKFELNGEQYGEYIVINKPSVSAEEALKAVNELCIMIVNRMNALHMSEHEGVKEGETTTKLKKTSAQELKETIPEMLSNDYKERFKAEYHQTKIRYERLKKFNTRIEAALATNYRKNAVEMPVFDCPQDLLREQQRAMGEYLHILEVRAVIESIEL